MQLTKFLDMQPTYIDGWQSIDTSDGYRVCGVPRLIWFIQGPLNNVVAHPPAHLTICEALDWFRRKQNETGVSHAAIQP